MSNDYCTTANINQIFGPDNVSEWADLNNNDVANEIAAQIAWAIDVASDEIDDYLRSTHHQIPLITAAGATPASITDLAATLAGVRLYENRGVEEMHDGQPVHKLLWARQRVEKALADIVAGSRRLDAI